MGRDEKPLHKKSVLETLLVELVYGRIGDLYLIIIDN